MIIIVASLLSLVISYLFPWYFICVLAVGVYSFRPKNHSEILFISLGIFILHSVLSFILDLQASSLISLRVSGLFGLPFTPLFHLIVGLVPGLVFLMTSYVVLEARTLVKRRPRVTEKRG